MTLSTLGKVLTILVALVSVVVAVLVAREFVFIDNYKSLLDEQKALYNLAIDDRDKAIQQRNKVQGERLAERAQLDERINTLSDELALRNNTIKTLGTEKENQEKRLQELATQYKGLNDTVTKLVQEKDSWRKERDDAMKRADELQTMYAETESRLRAVQADNANLKEGLRLAREQVAALESRLAYIDQNYPQVKLPPQVPAVPNRPVGGLVTKADNEAKVAEINLGADDGVVKGMKFFVYNEGEMKYLATLTINMVSKQSAAGELSIIRGTVKANDHVTNRFE
jgi:DNA repair exonuclease SbcCD ATPase subunit